MTAYYNEIDPYCAQWLRNLIAAGLIAPGDVDERSIEDVRPSDLMGYTQCHFFAGIGVWAYALRRSGWADDRPVWTGSCPCQPFSAAGEGLGFADERHLWPAFHHLIRERKPAVVFGEQVASKDADPWIDIVQTDLEAMGYAVGAVPFPSAGVGAPHIRDRLYWVADARGFGRERREAAAPGNDDDRTASERAQGEHGIGVTSAHRLPEHSASPTNGHWRVADWLLCRDGKWRPVEPGTFPLAHGAPARVGRLRAYGNAINAEAAIAFITATEEAKLFL
jgi:DNA (cytosine-5)-methyltransferase 1